jgi:hypothetical protein
MAYVNRLETVSFRLSPTTSLARGVFALISKSSSGKEGVTPQPVNHSPFCRLLPPLRLRPWIYSFEPFNEYSTIERSNCETILEAMYIQMYVSTQFFASANPLITRESPGERGNEVEGTTRRAKNVFFGSLPFSSHISDLLDLLHIRHAYMRFTRSFSSLFLLT